MSLMKTRPLGKWTNSCWMRSVFLVIWCRNTGSQWRDSQRHTSKLGRFASLLQRPALKSDYPKPGDHRWRTSLSWFHFPSCKMKGVICVCSGPSLSQRSLEPPGETDFMRNSGPPPWKRSVWPESRTQPKSQKARTPWDSIQMVWLRVILAPDCSPHRLRWKIKA